MESTPIYRLHTAFKRCAATIGQDKYKQKARALREEVEHAFTGHPVETGETYLQHLWFTCKMAFRFVLVSLVLVTHGLFPFLFVRTASAQIEKIYVIMKSRIPKTRRDVLDDYEI